MTEADLLRIRLRMEALITERESMLMHDRWVLDSGRNGIYGEEAYDVIRCSLEKLIQDYL
jgi:hypothetical protein